MNAVAGAKETLTVHLEHRCIGAAGKIARQLCRDAVWSAAGCNWMSWQIIPTGTSQVVERYASTNASVYDGTTGIALFLAHYLRYDDDPIVHETLDGVLDVIEARMQDIREMRNGSAYAGIGGIAIVMDHIARLRGDEALARRADRWLDEAVEFLGECEEIDVLSGVAGMLPPLVSRGAERRADARRLAERLLSRATRTDIGLEWPTGASAGDRSLTGFSHGAAGIAWSLSEVAYAVSSQELLDAAMDTVRAENAGWSDTQGNWLDFRDFETGGRDVGRQAVGSPADTAPERETSMSAWCHGAPGIALARSRMADLIDDAALESDARRAIEHVRIASAHDPRQVGHSLCHGLLGNLEIMVEKSVSQGPGAPRGNPDGRGRIDRGRTPGESISHRDFLREVVATTLDGIELGHPWRCGTRSMRQVPGLMLGLSGIGYFLLRCVESLPRPPSVLLMTSGSFDQPAHVWREPGTTRHTG